MIRNLLVIGLATAACLATVGCRPSTPDPAPSASGPDPQSRQLSDLRAEAARLQDRLDVAQRTQKLQEARIAELKERNSRLANELSAARFTVQQYRLQLQALAVVPAERDEIKAKYDKALSRIGTLERRLRHLTEQVLILKGEIPPSTQPAP